MSGLVVIWSNVGEPKTIPEIRDGDLTGLHEAAPAPPITDPTYDPGPGVSPHRWADHQPAASP
jgi:hypothetical protein